MNTTFLVASINQSVSVGSSVAENEENAAATRS